MRKKFTLLILTVILSTALKADVSDLLINEVDAVGSKEFIELFGEANSSLDDVKVVLFSGDTDQVYAVYDLSGQSTDSSGYFLIANASIPLPDITLPENGLEDKSSAIAIYFTSDVIETNDSLSTLSSTRLIDAFVYDSGDAVDLGLLSLLNNNQLQVNENSKGLAEDESNARCINGSGEAFNTSTYQQVMPTPGLINSVCNNGSDYYDSITPEIIADPDLLRSALHNLIDGHTTFPYSHTTTDACDIIEDADADPDNSNEVWMLYSNLSYTDNDSCAGIYNREHTWPNSRFSGGTGSTVGKDTHHLMATNKDYNQRRDSAYFDYCESGCINSGLTTSSNNGVGGGSDHGASNWRDSNSQPDIFEVWDYRKGDVARAMFYMDVRYEGDSGEPDLILTDDTNILLNRDENYMGKLTTLCHWHYADPVDDNDNFRNETIYTYQQNRNPFVDHPEWVAKVFAECAAVDPNAGVNNAPIADAQNVTTDMNMAVAITLTASDADSDPLIYTLTSTPVNGVLSGIAPNLSYTPNSSFVGPDSFTFKVNDGTDDSAEATISITVNNVIVNNAPIADAQNVITDMNMAVAITLTASDADSDPLTYTLTSSPTNGVLSGIAPNVSYTPNPSFVGPDSFTFKVNDGTEDSLEATISITVSDIMFINGFEGIQTKFK